MTPSERKKKYLREFLKELEDMRDNALKENKGKPWNHTEWPLNIKGHWIPYIIMAIEDTLHDMEVFNL